MKKFYTCKYDREFKEVIKKEENKDILKEILQVEIKEIEYLNLERNIDNIKVKRKHLDLYL